MCGIAGILRFDGQPIAETQLQAMTDALQHRGPDGSGAWVSDSVGLGHRRLSIIDLESGQQPLCNEDQSVWVVFNGEIYNYRELSHQLKQSGHRFQTSSDTEVIVHAWEQWGHDCVQHLRGMFAFAIWDKQASQLFLARDRVGIKPLVYAQYDWGILFASEIQGLQAHQDFQGTIDLQAIDQYLHYQYIPAPKTIYREVRKLEPGHSLLLNRSGKVEHHSRYWRVQFRPDRSLSEAEWIERLDAALQETVQSHLVSDVPFGAFLSGGIDSSTVLAYMSQQLDDPVLAFCIGHDEQGYDERVWARQAAEKCGAQFLEEVVQPQGLELLPELVKHYGEPFADSSAIPTYYVSQLASRHVKMVLSGDGGDELFAGYHAYRALQAEHRSPVGLYHASKHYVANLARQMGLWPQRPDLAAGKYLRSGVMAPMERENLWRSEFRDLNKQTCSEFRRHFREVAQSEVVNHLQAFDLEHYIPYDNLVKVDIASMIHSLEVRVPLLDHQFIEVAAQVPPELKLTQRTELSERPIGKYLLKRVAGQFYDDRFLHRKKLGFEVAVQSWFAGPHQQLLQERLTDPGGPLQEWFDPSALQSIANQAGQDKIAAWRAWSLLVLQEWADIGCAHRGKAHNLLTVK